VGNVILDEVPSLASRFLKRWFRHRELGRIRLSPLKVLLYLESHRRKERVSTPERLGREIGIGGYDTIKDSYLWLLGRKYIAPAPGTPIISPTEILDPREFVVTPLGKKALKPYLATFSLAEVASVAATTLGLGFVLGLSYFLFQLYPSYLGFLTLLDVVVTAVFAIMATLTLKEDRQRYKERVASLIESVTDRG
jgi:hypothetical protein